MKRGLQILVPIILLAFIIYWNQSDKFTITTPTLVNGDLQEIRTDEKDLTKEKRANNPAKPFSEKKKKVKGVEKNDSPNLFVEWHNGIRTMPEEQKSAYKINYQIDELLKAKGVNSTKKLSASKISSALDWRELGPGNVAGRTRSILIHPDNKDLWYVGSVGGGVWKTPDAGHTWINLSADLPNLATSALAWSESNPDIIYAGTGEGFGSVDQIDGSGIWKTTDAGESWTQLISTVENPDFENVMRLAVDQTNPNIIVSAVAPGYNYLSNQPTSGIYRSTDGGETWTKTLDVQSYTIQDLRANPLNFNTMYAAINGHGVIKSLDGGLTWADQSEAFTSVTGRIELAIAPSDTNVVYAAAQGGESGSILYSTTDGGENWYYHNNEELNVNWLGDQGWYDNTLVVNPYNAYQLFAGGPQLWQLDVSNAVSPSDYQVTGVDFENTYSFFALVNWGGSFAGGGLDYGFNFHSIVDGITAEDFSTVEIRFGPGLTQMAYRFLYADNFQYEYQDYVEVPFQVWDITNNKQLMVSFRDQDGDGAWNLKDRATATGGVSRDYLFINAVEYSENPDANIAKTAGFAYKNTYAMWPELPTGGTFDPENLPSSYIRINWGFFETKGVEFTNIADAYTDGMASKGIHVDHHALVTIKTDEATESFRLVNGNDGGVAFSDDKGATFSQTGDAGRVLDEGDLPNEILYGYNTTQFYGIDKFNGYDIYIGGMQDNGSWMSSQNPNNMSIWPRVLQGDGFECVAKYDDASQFIVSSQYNGIVRVENGGASSTFIGGFIDNESGNAPFFTRIASSKQDPDLIFSIGVSGVWRSDNFGDSYTLTQMPDGFAGTATFSQIKISLANPQIVWSAYAMKEGSVPMVSVDGGLSFNNVNLYTSETLGRISGFATHPTDENTAYALFGTKGTPKILRTTNLGNTWEDITGFEGTETSSKGFPDVVVYSMLVMPYNTNIIWAGTEIGLFESTDGGNSWAYANNGLPPVSIYQMKIVNDEIIVATHGRGAWAVSIPELEGYEPNKVTLSPRLTSVAGGANGNIFCDITFPSQYDSSLIFVDNEKQFFFDNTSSEKDTNIVMSVFAEEIDTVNIQIVSYKDGKQYLSSVSPVMVFGLLEAQYSYTSDFTNTEGQFLNNGFEFTSLDGFDNEAAHSPHNYEDGTEYILMLKTPIIVSESGTTLSYDDIAIIEPGDEGTVYGDYEFWDYVVVEASNNMGATWQNIAPGYDARYNSQWLESYTNQTVPDKNMLVNHSLKLNDIFEPGEQVIILFRLLADANTNGWGWVIDNINIEGEVVGVAQNDNGIPDSYSLDQNYPNPFNPTTTIKFGLPNDSKVVVKIYDILGRQVTTLVDEQLKAGYHSINWNASSLASGTYIYRITAGNFVGTKKMMLVK